MNNSIETYIHKTTGLIGNRDDSHLILSDYVIPMKIVENSNEWEKINKPYIVMSFKAPNTGNIFERVKSKMSLLEGNGNFAIESSPDALVSYDYLIGQGCEIYSIKRLSDGEIITVGDGTNYGTVEKIDKNGAIRFVKGGVCGCQTDRWRAIEVVDEPVLITEEGDEMYEGDIIYTIDSKYWTIKSHTVVKDKFNNELVFSKEQTAVEYIEWNKPLYSKQQLRDALETFIAPF